MARRDSRVSRTLWFGRSGSRQGRHGPRSVRPAISKLRTFNTRATSDGGSGDLCARVERTVGRHHQGPSSCYYLAERFVGNLFKITHQSASSPTLGVPPCAASVAGQMANRRRRWYGQNGGGWSYLVAFAVQAACAAAARALSSKTGRTVAVPIERHV